MVVVNIAPFPSPWVIGMAPSTFYVRMKDDQTGQAINITGATLSGKLGTNVLGGAFTIADANTGTFFYAPNGSEANGLAAGRYQLQFKGTGGPSGLIITELFPIDVQVAL